MKLHELQETRASAVIAMRALADLADTEKRDLTTDEDKRFGDLKTSIADLDKKIGRAHALAEAERTAPAIVHGRLGDGAFEERARDFSIVKAIRALLPRDLGGGDVDAGFEREVSAEVARRSGREFQGLAVPDEVFQEKRTLLAGSSAMDLIPNVHRGDLFIDRLRNRLVVARLGATYLDGLVGSPIDIPRQVVLQADGSPRTTLSETDATFDDVSLTPKTVGAMTSYSRRTLSSMPRRLDRADHPQRPCRRSRRRDDQKAMIGDGSGNTPTGITNAGATETTGICTDNPWPTCWPSSPASTRRTLWTAR